MKDLIYYPTFEPRDLNWIKYALIYIDKFSPIIPDPGKTELSELYWTLFWRINISWIGRTDFIE